MAVRDGAVVACGADSLVIKDAAAQRRNELLQLALQSPMAQQVVGAEGVAHMLREQAKTLGMNADKIVPPPEVVRARQMLLQAQQQQMMAAQAAQPAQAARPGGETLMDGEPVTDTFAPAPAPAPGG
ncbi:MAG: hypothetical protein LBD70_07930 [Bifidobacteriaceae bacterium]|nr:hypothetical protein [Bifidobacteriaceae bacterium]